mgnify:FL=1
MAITKLTSASIQSNAVGVTLTDQWRISGNTNSGTNGDVTTPWERNDTASYGGIGTGLTESSGVFTFPQTGIYFIYFVARILNNSGDSTAQFSLKTTTDNSTYNESARANTGGAANTSSVETGSNTFVFDVTNTSTHKFKFATDSFDSGTVLLGITDYQRTGFTVIRLGDT